MFAQPMMLNVVDRKRVAFGLIIASAAMLFSGLFGGISAHAQTDSSDTAVEETMPTNTTINLDTTDDNTGLPNTGSSDVVASPNTWLILAVIVVAVALMIVGWGMGARSSAPSILDR